jgi:DNA-binding CsgD family transcriptional regulator
MSDPIRVLIADDHPLFRDGLTAMLQAADDTELTAAPAAPAIFPQLTDREREVLELVAQGRSNADIAARLQLSQKTVRNHVSNILTKLQRAERSAALCEAFTRLPPRSQQLIALLIEDPPVPDAEISARLGIPAGRVGRDRARCLERLRRYPAIATLISAGTGR